MAASRPPSWPGRSQPVPARAPTPPSTTAPWSSKTPHAPLPTGIQDTTPAQPPSGDRARLGDQRVRVSVRRLTPRECERLQGFPDDWTALHAWGRPVSDAARYRAIGNAVAVPVIAWVGRRLLAVHQRPAPTPSRQRRPGPPLLPTADAVEVPRA